MSRRQKRVNSLGRAGSAIGAALLITGQAIPAVAAERPEPSTSGGAVLTMFRPDGQVAAEVRSPRAPADVRCFVRPTNPHWSRGAGSVIYKTYVNCVGSLPQVVVRVQGTLGSVAGSNGPRPPAGPPVPRARSNEAQPIVIGAKAIPFYTPQVGAPGVRGNGWYQGTSTAQITSPGLSELGTISTASVFVNAG